MAIEALADGAVKMGMPRKTALKFAAQTCKVNINYMNINNINCIYTLFNGILGCVAYLIMIVVVCC